MEATARTVLAIFLFCSILFPLASAWIWDELYYERGLEYDPIADAESSLSRNMKHHGVKPKKAHHKEEGGKTKKHFPKFNPNDVAADGGGVGGGAVEMAAGGQGGLRVGFYQKSCPRAEKIVYDVVTKANDNAADLLAGIVRLQFHDCFVNGCDASILLDKTPSGEKVEKESPANNIKGLNVMDDAKSELEKECPGIVSCADIIAFAARDALNISGIPRFEIPGGRRDGLASREADVNPDNIPAPTDSVDKMIAMFERKGLTAEDMVVLTGAHSIGVSSCFSFAYRVQKPGADKELNPRLGLDIRTTCREQHSLLTLPFDPITPYKMDVDYYTDMLDKKALLESDQLMATDPKTAGFMRQLAGDEQGWFDKYAKSTVRMGNIGVLTGTQGEIRKQCRFVN